ncbi:hypothetical protein FQZ97_979020 [compost metagenome]
MPRRHPPRQRNPDRRRGGAVRLHRVQRAVPLHRRLRRHRVHRHGPRRPWPQVPLPAPGQPVPGAHRRLRGPGTAQLLQGLPRPGTRQDRPLQPGPPVRRGAEGSHPAAVPQLCRPRGKLQRHPLALPGHHPRRLRLGQEPGGPAPGGSPWHRAPALGRRAQAPVR